MSTPFEINRTRLFKPPHDLLGPFPMLKTPSEYFRFWTAWNDKHFLETLECQIELQTLIYLKAPDKLRSSCIAKDEYPKQFLNFMPVFERHLQSALRLEADRQLDSFNPSEARSTFYQQMGLVEEFCNRECERMVRLIVTSIVGRSSGQIDHFAAHALAVFGPTFKASIKAISNEVSHDFRKLLAIVEVRSERWQQETWAGESESALSTAPASPAAKRQSGAVVRDAEPVEVPSPEIRPLSTEDLAELDRKKAQQTIRANVASINTQPTPLYAVRDGIQLASLEIAKRRGFLEVATRQQRLALEAEIARYEAIKDRAERELAERADEELTRPSARPPAITAKTLEQPAKDITKSVTDWTMIEISFLSDERVEIRIEGKTETRNYAELGFADGRNEKPIRAWQTLDVLAETGGTIEHGTGGSEWVKIEKQVEKIRKIFRVRFGISGDPIPHVKRFGYRARFKIRRAPSYDS